MHLNITKSLRYLLEDIQIHIAHTKLKILPHNIMHTTLTLQKHKEDIFKSLLSRDNHPDYRVIKVPLPNKTITPQAHL